jgi:hypothetical protein
MIVRFWETSLSYSRSPVSSRPPRLYIEGMYIRDHLRLERVAKKHSASGARSSKDPPKDHPFKQLKAHQNLKETVNE